LIPAAALLALALAYTVLEPLLASAVVLGVAGGLCLNASLATTVERVEQQFRGGVSSAFFAGIYVMLAVPAVGVGVLARVTDLRTAGIVFSGLVATLGAGVAVAQLVARRRT
jgi:hypothetical protein